MSKADDFWQYAEEALRSATKSKSERQKQALVDLARTWMQAALKADASTSNNNPPNQVSGSRP
jgi:adenosyl cobinamide kinase/adenosyl cobinamide phosphate guanylyltransferase